MNMFLLRLAVTGIFLIIELFSIMHFGIIGGLLPLMLLGLAFLGKPRFLLFVLWLWAVLGPIASLYIPSKVGIIMDIVLLFVLLATYVLKRNKFYNIRPIIIATIGLLALTCISFFVNRPSPIMLFTSAEFISRKEDVSASTK